MHAGLGRGNMRKTRGEAGLIGASTRGHGARAVGHSPQGGVWRAAPRRRFRAQATHLNLWKSILLPLRRSSRLAFHGASCSSPFLGPPFSSSFIFNFPTPFPPTPGRVASSFKIFIYNQGQAAPQTSSPPTLPPMAHSNLPPPSRSSSPSLHPITPAASPFDFHALRL